VHRTRHRSRRTRASEHFTGRCAPNSTSVASNSPNSKP
jgi:hypothetical protein